MAWLSGWNYRRKITVTNNSGTDVTDYQIEIVLDSNNFDFSKANADGSDIRFTEDDGQTLLSYWIEKWDSTNEEARVWVKVPSILDGSSTDIYMYYGNSSAEDASSGDDTFIFFDDFEGDSLDENKWFKHTTSGDIYVENSLCKMFAEHYYSTTLGHNVPGSAFMESREDFSLSSDYLVILKYYDELDQGTNNDVEIKLKNSRTALEVDIDGNNAEFFIDQNSVGSLDEETENWYIRKIGTSSYCDNDKSFTSYEDGSEKISDNNTPTHVFDKIQIYLTSSFYNSVRLYVDWVAINKYACNISSSIGEEELPSTHYTKDISELVTCSDSRKFSTKKYHTEEQNIIDKRMFNSYKINKEINSISDSLKLKNDFFRKFHNYLTISERRKTKTNLLKPDSLTLADKKQYSIKYHKKEYINIEDLRKSNVKKRKEESINLNDTEKREVNSNRLENIVLEERKKEDISFHIKNYLNLHDKKIYNGAISFSGLFYVSDKEINNGGKNMRENIDVIDKRGKVEIVFNILNSLFVDDYRKFSMNIEKSENVNIEEWRNFILSIAFGESVIVKDLKRIIFSRDFIEDLSLADSLEEIILLGRILEEIIRTEDKIGEFNVEYNIGELVEIEDKRKNKILREISEEFGLSEEKVIEIYKIAKDVLLFLDEKAFNIWREFVEVGGINDKIAKSISQYFEEASRIESAFNEISSKIFSDAVDISDKKKNDISIKRTENLTIYDKIANKILAIIKENIEINDALFENINYVLYLIVGLSLSDMLRKGVGKKILESLIVEALYGKLRKMFLEEDLKMEQLMGMATKVVKNLLEESELEDITEKFK